MGAGPIRALTGGRRTKPTSTGCRRLRQPEPGRRSTYQAGEPVQTNRASSHRAPAQAPLQRVALPTTVLVPPPALGRKIVTVWQVAAGDGSRDYSDVFLKFGVVLVGPGSEGTYFSNKDIYNDPNSWAYHPFISLLAEAVK